MTPTETAAWLSEVEARLTTPASDECTCSFAAGTICSDDCLIAVAARLVGMVRRREAVVEAARGYRIVALEEAIRMLDTEEA